MRNDSVGLWGADEAWHLRRLVSIGAADGSGPDVFGNVADIEVDDLGRVWVLDRASKAIQVFGFDGSHIISVGQRGSGPGEFKDPIAIAWGPDELLWVIDPPNARYSVFDTSGHHVTGYPRPLGSYSVPWRGMVTGDGNVYDVMQIEGQPFLIGLDTVGAVFDSVKVPATQREDFEVRSQSSTLRVSVPFSPRGLWLIDPLGHLWHARSDEYRLVQETFGGDRLVVVEKVHRSVSITSAERDSALQALAWFVERGGRLDPSRVPKQKPVLTDFVVDDQGFLWVRRVSGDTGFSVDVFRPEGRYLGEVAVPSDFGWYPAPVIKGRTVWGLVYDSNDVAYVTRWEIEGR